MIYLFLESAFSLIEAALKGRGYGNTNIKILALPRRGRGF